MNTAFLRGFDRLLQDLEGSLSFCRPLISLDSGTSAPVYYSSNLDWSLSDQDESSLIRVEEDDISAFGTLFPAAEDVICSGTGLIVMDTAFAEEARQRELLDDTSFTLRPYEDPHCLAGVCDPQAFVAFEQSIVNRAKRIFDTELGRLANAGLGERGDAALHLLQKCGSSRDSDVAIRELAASLVTGNSDLYRRLLIQFSIELGEAEGTWAERAELHIKYCRLNVQFREIPYNFESLSEFRHM